MLGCPIAFNALQLLYQSNLTGNAACEPGIYAWLGKQYVLLPRLISRHSHCPMHSLTITFEASAPSSCGATSSNILAAEHVNMPILHGGTGVVGT